MNFDHSSVEDLQYITVWVIFWACLTNTKNIHLETPCILSSTSHDIRHTHSFLLSQIHSKEYWKGFSCSLKLATLTNNSNVKIKFSQINNLGFY